MTTPAQSWRAYQLGRASTAAYLLGDVESRLVDAIRAARRAGATYDELRASTGMSVSALRRVANGGRLRRSGQGRS